MGNTHLLSCFKKKKKNTCLQLKAVEKIVINTDGRLFKHNAPGDMLK